MAVKRASKKSVTPRTKKPRAKSVLAKLDARAAYGSLTNPTTSAYDAVQKIAKLIMGKLGHGTDTHVSNLFVFPMLTSFDEASARITFSQRYLPRTFSIHIKRKDHCWIVSVDGVGRASVYDPDKPATLQKVANDAAKKLVDTKP